MTGAADSPELRRRLIEEIERRTDPRADRHWQLVATERGNTWPVEQSQAPGRARGLITA